MSLTLSGRVSAQPVRRVRDEVKDGMAVIAFSAVASSGLAAAFMIFLSVLAQGR